MKILDKDSLKFVLLNNFSQKEISLIMKAVKQLFPEKVKDRSLIFATTTEESKNMKLAELIEDISEDHLYLLQNPPNKDTNNSKK